MSSFQKKEFFFTPVGVVEPYCYIAKPDFGHGSFASERGKYKINLTIPSEKAQDLIDKIVKKHETSYAKRLAEHKKNPPAAVRGKKPLTPYEGDLPFFENDDGTVTFKFSCYSSYEKDGEVIPIVLKVVDAKGKRIEKVPNISGGSEGKVRFSMIDYGWTATVGASVKLQLDSFMLTKLVEFAAGSDDWAGQEEEGGFVADDTNTNHGTTKSDWDDETVSDDEEEGEATEYDDF
jgi:hypothetical protein